LRDPYDHGGLLLQELGTFELNLRALNKRIEGLIPYLRNKEDKYYSDKVKTFKDLWKRRQLAITYENKRRSTNRYFSFDKGVGAKDTGSNPKHKIINKEKEKK